MITEYKKIFVLACLFILLFSFSLFLFIETVVFERVRFQESITKSLGKPILPILKKAIYHKEEKLHGFIYQMEVKLTGYAPLDPKAKRGMCFSGDRNMTASGKKVRPGVTLAASRAFPFGTEIFIPGLGWRVVEDRGSRIKRNKLDICFNTQKEALDWGVRKSVVWVRYPVKDL